MTNTERTYRDEIIVDCWHRLVGELWPFNMAPGSETTGLSGEELAYLCNLRPVRISETNNKDECLCLVIRESDRLRFSAAGRLLQNMPRMVGANDTILFLVEEDGLVFPGHIRINFDGDLAVKAEFNIFMFPSGLTSSEIEIYLCSLLEDTFSPEEPIFPHTGDYLPVRPDKLREFRRSNSLPYFIPKIALDAWRKEVSRIWGNPWEWRLSKKETLSKLTALMNLQPVLPCTTNTEDMVAITFFDKDALDASDNSFFLAIPMYRNYSGETAVTIFFKPISLHNDETPFKNRVMYYRDNAAILSLDAAMPLSFPSQKDFEGKHYKKIFSCYKACNFSDESAGNDDNYSPSMCKQLWSSRQEAFMKPRVINEPKVVELWGQAIRMATATGDLTSVTSEEVNLGYINFQTKMEDDGSGPYDYENRSTPPVVCEPIEIPGGCQECACSEEEDNETEEEIKNA